MSKRMRKLFKEVAERPPATPDMVCFPLSHMKPTQITVGMGEVEQKRQRLRDLAKHPAKLEKFLRKHPVRVVLGPDETAYIVDRHHLGLALALEGYVSAHVEVYADLSKCGEKEFWKKMEELHFLHLKDGKGQARPLSALPPSLSEMQDDPYRSLAAVVRNAGGFQKVRTPYAEFQWADFFRKRIPEDIVTTRFYVATGTAMALAKTPAARNLSRLCGALPGKTRASFLRPASLAYLRFPPYMQEFSHAEDRRPFPSLLFHEPVVRRGGGL